MIAALTGGPRPPATSRKALRVGIVDDDPLVRRMLKRVFTKITGVEVVAEAADGQEALDITRRARPHALVMDLEMPVMDGIEATRALTSEMPEVMVFVFSSDESRREAALAAGACAFIRKSVSLTPLVVELVRLASNPLIEALATLPPDVRGRVVRSANEAIAVTRRRSREVPVIAYVNEAFSDLTGYGRDEVAGQSIDFWLTLGVDLDRWTEIGTTLRAGRTITEEVALRKKSGARVRVTFTMLPFGSGDSLDVITVIAAA